MSFVVYRYQETIADSDTGRPVGGALITVNKYPEDTPATIYSADGSIYLGAVKTAKNGRFSFYVEAGRYNIYVNGSLQWEDVSIAEEVGANDPQIDLIILPSGSDDTAAFASAAAAMVPVRLVDNGIYRVSSFSTIPKKLSGSATIRLTSRNNDWILINCDNVQWKDVVFDACNLATRGIIIDNASHIKLSGVTVKNLQQFSDSTTTVDAIRIKDNCYDILIKKCTVSAVNAYANGVVGDTLGAARGIHIENVAVSGTTVGNIRIKDCDFDSVGGREDGDSIVIQGFTAPVDVTISGCYFTNLGKRAIKVMSPGVKILHNRMFSTYAGAGGDVNQYLYSYISVYASDVEVVGNVGRGGSVQLALDIGTPAWGISNVTVLGNKMLQDSGDFTYSVGTRYIATVDHSVYAGNIIRGMGEGLTLTGAISDVIIDDNAFDVTTTASSTSGNGIRLAAYAGNSPSYVSVGRNYANVGKYGLLIKDQCTNIAYSGELFGSAPFGMWNDAAGNALVLIQTPPQRIYTPSTVQNAVFAGAGLNDLTAGGAYSGTSSPSTFTVVIDGTGGTNTFKWKKDSGGYTTGVAITGAAQALQDGVTVSFGTTAGHTLNDTWTIAVTTQAPLIIYNSAGTPIATFNVDGSCTYANTQFAPALRTGSDGYTLSLQTTRNYGGAATAINLGSGTFTHSVGLANGVKTAMTYTQSGSASSTDYLINRTENSLGTGPHRFVDFQVGGVSKFGVDRLGVIMQAVGGVVASAATITPTGAIFHVTGTTPITTINLPFTGFTGSIKIIPDAAFTLGDTGNIGLASTAVVGKVLELTYDGTKWYPSY